jgi:NADH dehydrogenase (ubiquinone) Fe-S protein 3
MQKKYKFPMNIFVVFEKLNPIVFTSNKLPNNHFVCFIDKNWYVGVNLFLKNELFYSFSTLTEISAIDTLKYTKIFPENEYFNKNNRFIMFNVYYTYFAKIRLTLLCSVDRNIQSIESIYKNANWLERETSEMFGIGYINKKDSRPLLLDYSRNEFPMLKDFPTEGYQDIYYNFFENKLTYIQNEFIEL